MTRRSDYASFAPGAYVFPAAAWMRPGAPHRPARRRTQSRAQLDYAVAAVRESFEELGVLLAEHADGRPVSAAEIMPWTGTPRPTASSRPSARRARGLRLATRPSSSRSALGDRLRPAQGGDVLFLVARMPEGHGHRRRDRAVRTLPGPPGTRRSNATRRAASR